MLAACEDSNKRKDPPPPPHSTAPQASAAGSAGAAAPGITIDPAQLAPFAGFPARFENPKNPLTEDKIALGQKLYFENRLSKNQTISCNSCHKLNAFGIDPERRTSLGHKAQLGGRNSPTTLNAAGHSKQFWDGRATDVEDQALKPMLNPVEMAMPSEKAVLAVLESMPEYAEAFKKAFPEDKQPLTAANVAKAIGAFERTLATPSKFDAFVKGDAKALSEDEKAGFEKFVKVGCTTCHSGVLVGGVEFKKLGQVKPYPNLKDVGRFEVTKQEADRFVFKVPSLRNVAKTAPYLHDGSIATLEETVKLMGTYQLGIELADPDVSLIVAFLRSLTGQLAEVKTPQLPASTAKTPKPILD